MGNTGNTLQRLRIKECLTIKEMAKKCGCSLSIIYHVEKGTRMPSVSLFEAMINALERNRDSTLIIEYCFEKSGITSFLSRTIINEQDILEYFTPLLKKKGKI